VTVTEQEHHEQGLAQFVVPQWRTRFRESLDSPKRRAKLRSQLAHFAHLDSRFATELTHADLATLAATLRSKGAGDRCYLISESSDLNGREMALDDALAQLAGDAEATFVSCVPGRLAYFHDEAPEPEYLLEHSGL
jgi:hypothetical protein